MAKHLAKKAACLIGSAAVALSMTLGAFPVYADSATSAPELGPVTSKDVVYQIITDRFYDGDTSNNVPAGFDATLCDGTGQDLKLYQGGDWAGIIEKIPYLKGMGVTAVWISAPYENRDTEIIDYQSDGSLNRWTSFHGYHVRNYFATNKHFGTLNEFKNCGMHCTPTALSWLSISLKRIPLTMWKRCSRKVSLWTSSVVC